MNEIDVVHAFEPMRRYRDWCYERDLKAADECGRFMWGLSAAIGVGVAERDARAMHRQPP